jgi:hypothetical protein
LRACVNGSLGKGMPLFTGRTVGKHPYRVKRFLRASSGDHHFFSGQRTAPSKSQSDVAKQFVRFEHAPLSTLTRCQVTFCRACNGCTVFGQLLQVLLSGWMVEHVAFHGRGDQERAVC